MIVRSSPSGDELRTMEEGMRLLTALGCGSPKLDAAALRPRGEGRRSTSAAAIAGPVGRGVLEHDGNHLAADRYRFRLGSATRHIDVDTGSIVLHPTGCGRALDQPPGGLGPVRERRPVDRGAHPPAPRTARRRRRALRRSSLPRDDAHDECRDDDDGHDHHPAAAPHRQTLEPRRARPDLSAGHGGLRLAPERRLRRVDGRDPRRRKHRLGRRRLTARAAGPQAAVHRSRPCLPARTGPRQSVRRRG